MLENPRRNYCADFCEFRTANSNFDKSNREFRIAKLVKQTERAATHERRAWGRAAPGEGVAKDRMSGLKRGGGFPLQNKKFAFSKFPCYN